MAGIELANWNWKVVHQFVLERFGVGLSRSGCLNYLHRLGFAFKRPKKRLVKADERKRESFVAEYAALTEEARRSGARIFFADEAHFRADAELRGKWVLRGEPALVDSTSPRYGEKASYYSAVCLAGLCTKASNHKPVTTRLVRRHLWMSPGGFSMSRRDSDSEKVPAALYDRLTDTPTYAARMYKVQLGDGRGGMDGTGG